jgi:2-keto-4-pentenoate hydratase/2-oxohepta-3-ene-1,7-dioic acid hydratase in catechol pathway
MRIARFLSNDGARLALMLDSEAIDLVAAAEERGQRWLVPLFRDLRLFLGGGEGSRNAALAVSETARHARCRSSELRLLAPYETGSKVLAHVVNYYGHDKEAGVKVPAKPFFFLKADGCVTNPDAAILTHPWSKKLDHEVELGVLMGKAGRDIPAERAYEHVAGYCVINDVSYRDLQFNEGFEELNKSYGKNWTQGKGMDFACPMGPLLVLSDEIPMPYPLRISCTVNGVLRQQANTADMIFKVPALIAEASKGITLFPGDVIATGTCAGGGLSDGKYLRSGDRVECQIENIGVLRNSVQ